MRSRDELAAWAREKIAYASKTAPAVVSEGRAYMVTGSIGYCGYVTVEGDVYLEEDTLAPEAGSFRVDRSAEARIRVLVLASRQHPELSAWLPERTVRDAECTACAASGWRDVVGISLLCQACNGLGWVRSGASI